MPDPVRVRFTGPTVETYIQAGHLIVDRLGSVQFEVVDIPIAAAIVRDHDPPDSDSANEREACSTNLRAASRENDKNTG